LINFQILKKLIKMLIRNIFLFICITIKLTPNVADAEPLKIIGWFNYETKELFNLNTSENNFHSNFSRIYVQKKAHNTSAQLALNLNDTRNVTFDQSFIEYKYKNANYGIGKIKRHWSFSPRTSLILSNNARPSTSIYFDIKGSKSDGYPLPWINRWSLEGFNSFLSNTNNPKNAMLMGLRMVIQPINNFKFELIKTSQWGGVGYASDLSALQASLLGNTNENRNKNINQMAGFGLSYKTIINKLPIRLYSQSIGEDEVGYLPNCYMHIIGSEIGELSSKFISKFGLEYVDTRIDLSSNGNCGPGTSYNNNTYKYTNYDRSLGAAIDGDSKLIMLRGSTALSKNMNINYSIGKVIINNYNNPRHRLSNAREKGLLSTLATTWDLNSLKLNGKITYQNFGLNESTKGLGLTFSAKYTF